MSDRLSAIKAALVAAPDGPLQDDDVGYWRSVSQNDALWLVAEVERLTGEAGKLGDIIAGAIHAAAERESDAARLDFVLRYAGSDLGPIWHLHNRDDIDDAMRDAATHGELEGELGGAV